jgi:hypothetical protein
VRRMKRSTMKPCPECGERKYLDIRVDRGGVRYIDLYAIECQWDSRKGSWESSEVKAIEAWNGVPSTNRKP